MKLQRYTAADAHRIEEIWAANMKPPKPEAPDAAQKEGLRRRVLRYITQGHQTSPEIAAAIHVKKQVVQNTLRELRTKGLVEVMATQKGARSNSINIYQLTAAGRAHLETDK